MVAALTGNTVSTPSKHKYEEDKALDTRQLIPN